ncbi:DUF4880 domain-containing protein [Exilibacterium tricleocarpae]|uniref:DUF4880 domain-containing protein n=1 Tax=Exilibacterium tricleocarpae TaxID=2591008 RepID=A0A545SP09_9GAMM|nr:DUF4880 domain-containing protein [Exilibacterium tricleocarpae]TQV66715.1 DUF4880 domain-containing protein [Exilibacterium tricleocarpae]
MSAEIEQACRWIARLDAGDMDAAEKLRLRRWLQRRENRRAFRQVRVLWADFDQLGAAVRGGEHSLPEQLQIGNEKSPWQKDK